MDKQTILGNYSNLYGQLNVETQEHSLNVGNICACCAPQLSLDAERAFKIGLLHDVGKIYIPSRILKKNKQLNDIEREVVDLHAYFGYRVLKISGESPSVYIPILFHHGFTKSRIIEPEETLTDELLHYTQLVHSADIFDAMARRRTYHDPYLENEIFKVLGDDLLCTKEIINALKLANDAIQKTNI